MAIQSETNTLSQLDEVIDFLDNGGQYIPALAKIFHEEMKEWPRSTFSRTYRAVLLGDEVVITKRRDVDHLRIRFVFSAGGTLSVYIYAETEKYDGWGRMRQLWPGAWSNTEEFARATRIVDTNLSYSLKAIRNGHSVIWL